MVCYDSVQMNEIVHTIEGFEGHPLRKDFPLTARIPKFDQVADF
jgi:NADH:ubiquinone oxidoreductase subunit C